MIFSRYNNCKPNEFLLEFENAETVYRRTHEREVDIFPVKKLRELEISKELQNINKVDLLVSSDCNNFHPSAQIALHITWWKRTALPFEK